MSGLNFDTINNDWGKAVAAQETAINNLGTQSGTLSSQDMMQMQMATAKWSMMINMQSTLIKTLGDTMKGVVQKIG